MIDDEKYEKDVNNAFKKMSEAQTPEEIKEILDNWPEKENYFVKNEEEIPELTPDELKDLGYEIENLQE